MKTISLAGTVGKDAVMRRTQGGEPVLGFSVAVDDGFGENKSTMWFDLNIWGKRAQSLETVIKKGMRVAVSGDFGARQHDAKTYFTCRVSDITILGGGEKPKQEERDSYGNKASSFSTDLNDDLPF